MSIVKGGPQQTTLTPFYSQNNQVISNVQLATSNIISASGWTIKGYDISGNTEITLSTAEYSIGHFTQNNDTNNLIAVGFFSDGNQNANNWLGIATSTLQVPSGANYFWLMGSPSGNTEWTPSGSILNIDVFIDLSFIKNMYLGSTVIPRAYLGGTLLFGTTPPSYYYLEGDEFTGTTGGWVETFTQGGGFTQKNSDNLRAVATGTSGNDDARWGTSNSINISGKSTLHVVCTKEGTTSSTNRMYVRINGQLLNVLEAPSSISSGTQPYGTWSTKQELVFDINTAGVSNGVIDITAISHTSVSSRITDLRIYEVFAN